MKLLNNIPKLKEALKIQADREYKQLIEKAVNLETDEIVFDTDRDD